MLAQERRLRITKILNETETGMVSVSELSERLGVSMMTIRRDLDRLEQMAVLRRVRGGAVAYQGELWETPGEPEVHSGRDKQAIGWAAARLIEDGDHVLLDSGTTTPHIARNLNYRNDVVAVTHALPVADELVQLPKVTAVLIGGRLLHKGRHTYGPEVLRRLGRLSVDKCFLSAAGYSAEGGACGLDPHEVELKQAMMNAARQVILVADSTKWGRNTGFRIASLKNIDRFVVDDGIPAEAIGVFEAEGVEVITPGRVSAKAIFLEILEGHQPGSS